MTDPSQNREFYKMGPEYDHVCTVREITCDLVKFNLLISFEGKSLNLTTNCHPIHSPSK